MSNNRIGFEPNKFSHWLYALAGLSLIAGLILSVLSWLNICTEQCNEGHQYRLYGIKFEPFGLIFFTIALIFYTWSWFNKNLLFVTGLLLAAALGAEIEFISIQKHQIGEWCPLCLGIATTIAIASIALCLFSFMEGRLFIKKGETMGWMMKGSSLASALCLGLLFAMTGIAKIDKLAAAETTIKEQLAFGNKTSVIEAYIFTDWQCPACRKLEPKLMAIMPKIEKEAQAYFIDLDLHPESLNFTPFHLSFIVNNKDQYWNLRHMLTDISKNTVEPTEEEVETGAKKFGVNYKQLNYADVALGIRYFKRIGRQFGVKSTPTMVIINNDTKKGKKLRGTQEITEDNIFQAISNLKED